MPLTLSLPNASTQRAATIEESLPPDKATQQFFSLKSFSNKSLIHLTSLSFVSFALNL